MLTITKVSSATVKTAESYPELTFKTSSGPTREIIIPELKTFLLINIGKLKTNRGVVSVLKCGDVMSTELEIMLTEEICWKKGLNHTFDICTVRSIRLTTDQTSP